MRDTLYELLNSPQLSDEEILRLERPIEEHDHKPQLYYWTAQLGYTNELFMGEYFYMTSTYPYETSSEYAAHIPEPERIIAMTGIKEQDWKFVTQDDLPF